MHHDFEPNNNNLSWPTIFMVLGFILLYIVTGYIDSQPK